MRYIKSVKCTTPLIGLPPRPQIWVVKEQKINTHPAISAKHYKQVLDRSVPVFQFSPGSPQLTEQPRQPGGTENSPNRLYAHDKLSTQMLSVL